MSGTGAEQIGAQEISVHARDRVDADFLRACLLTFAVKRAGPEILQIHLLHHSKSPAIPLRLTLRQEAEVRNLGRGEE